MEIIGYAILFLLISISIVILITRLHAHHIIIKHYNFESQKIKTDCKICFVSDFHYTHYLSEKHYLKMLKYVNECQPDIVIFGGDYIHRKENAKKQDAQHFIELLAKINAPYKIGILGNHDKDNFDDMFWEQLFSQNNMPLLINEQKNISDLGINIIGVDDYKRGHSEIKEALTSDFQLLLTHNPDFVETIDISQFDLVLSGHLHGGQATLGFNTYPFLQIFKLSKYGLKYRHGNVGNDQYNHISTSGVGAHFGVRFCVYPEVVCVSLKKNVSK